MKLNMLEWNKKDNIMHLSVSGSTVSFINLIRRFAIDEVPTLAIETVEFRDNSSALYDEIIAHRLGLIPIKTDLKSYNLMENCSCKGEGCAKCQLKITLKSSKKGIVFASEAESQDPKCKFVYDNMLIVKLISKQKLEVEATAILGKGKDHAKWTPGLVYHRKEVEKIGSLNIKEDKKDYLSTACGDLISKDLKKIDVEKLNLSSRYDACISALEDSGVEITYNDNYLLTVESWGQLSCKEILGEVADIMIEQLDTLAQQIK